MLYDRHLKSSALRTDGDRRSDPRQGHDSEVVIAWICPALPPVRYLMLDISPGGLRIRSSSPLITGMLGRAVRLLPHGEMVNQTVSVAWTRPAPEGSCIEAGLRFQAPDR